MIKYKYSKNKGVSMYKYDSLPKEIIEQIESDRKLNKVNEFAFKDSDALRRNTGTFDKPTLFRSNFIRDVDKILNCPFYNRYSDKTQVFSFYKNDDITRRSLHVQLVSRIARTIGKALNLNLELIEAIALGHDLGHTPFGHAGEKMLDKLYFSHTKRHFAHNLQSIRVVDKIFSLNLSLQTLDGIAGHNGEIEKEVYTPSELKDFAEFDNLIEQCYIDKNKILTLNPSTLEGCVVRISDIIAYLGKDRQDGTRTKVYNENDFEKTAIGNLNAEIINNLSVNIIKNSYGKNYIKFDKEYFNDLVKAKKQNYKTLYLNKPDDTENIVSEMMALMFEKLSDDLKNSKKDSPIWTHHVNYINKNHYNKSHDYLKEASCQIVVDYIASMTDDYFIDLFKHLFPNSNLKIEYKGYFD